MYRRHRLDQNHKIIENALWKTGWAVLNLSQSQVEGCPDLFIAKGGRVVAVEIKSPTGRLSGPQASFQKAWPGECVVLRTVEDVLALTQSGQDRCQPSGAPGSPGATS
jgi:hypothetical protein